MSSMSDSAHPRRYPKKSSTDARAICTTSFDDARRVRTSSIMPRTKIAAAHDKGSHSCRIGSSSATPARSVVAMAGPPTGAVGRLCQRSSRGCST